MGVRGTLADDEDAFGHALSDFLKSKSAFEIIEREDGFTEATDVGLYFCPFRDWPPNEKAAMKYVRGRVLDIGCGAGRHSLYLQGKGFDVLGIDHSPLAVRVCKDRGLKKTKVASIDEVSPALGVFDTVLMLGNNFGVFGSPRRARWLLKKLDRATPPDARIIAQSFNIYRPPIPSEHRAYQALNRRRGRMPGQVRMRIRYREYATPWFDYLLVSKDEMDGVLKGTGWRIARLVGSSRAQYSAILEKRR